MKQITLKYVINGTRFKLKFARYDHVAAGERAAALARSGIPVVIQGMPKPGQDCAVWLKANGEQLHLKAKPSLRQAQIAVGGYVQLVMGRHPDTGVEGQMLCNEDGLSMGLPVNANATMYCLGHVPVGDCVWLTGDKEWT